MLDAQELKERLGEEARNIILNGLGVREKGKKINCPFHNDANPSMSWFKDGLMYKCHTCDAKMDIYTYYTEMERMSFQDAVNKVAELVGENPIEFKIKKSSYVKPNIKTNALSDKAIEYMKTRGINKGTLDHWKVEERKWGGQNVYVFNYFNAENELEYVSYRGIGKGTIKGGCEANTKPILWGMNNIDKNKPLVITEGQPDAMVIWQSGYTNVVSVPNGAKNLKWIDNCWDWLQDVREIILWADNDAPGLEMAHNVSKRLKNVKITVSEHGKDANEVLYRKGAKEVLNTVYEAINRIPEGLIDVSKLKYKSAIETQINGIETGFKEYDSHVEDWKEQELTIIFGRNGEGKTTFISQVIAHNLFKKNPVFLYSGEMSEQKLQDWLYKQIVGADERYYRYVEGKYKIKKELLPEYVEMLKEWHKDLFYLFDRSCDEINKDIDKFFEVMELAARRYGVRLFVIDNLMSKLEENADSLYSDQANFVQRCKNFAIDNNVHVVLLAHPNKEKRELDTEAEEGNLEKTDISGSNNIANKADNIISVERIFNSETGVDAIINSLKDRESGERLTMKFAFSKKTFRFYNETTVEKFNFGWEKKKMKFREEYIQTEPEEVLEVCPF